MAASQFCVTSDLFKNNISKGFSHLQQNAEFVDMTLAAEGHFVKVHQNILALASPYLKEMLLSTPCQHPIVFLNNITHEALGYILEYVYTGEVNVPKDIIGTFIEACRGLCIVGVENITENPDFSKEVPSQSKEFVNERLTHHPDHNYAAHITIGTQDYILEINPGADEITAENLTGPQAVTPVLPQETTQITSCDMEQENLDDNPPVNLPVMQQENIPILQQDNIPVILQDQIVTPHNNLSTIEQDNMAVMKPDSIHGILQDQIVTPHNNLSVMQQENIPIIQQDNIPVVLQDPIFTPHNNLSTIEQDNMPVMKPDSIHGILQDQIVTPHNKLSVMQHENIPIIQQGSKPIILKDQIFKPHNNLSTIDQDNMPVMKQDDIPVMLRGQIITTHNNLSVMQQDNMSIMKQGGIPVILQDEIVTPYKSLPDMQQDTFPVLKQDDLSVIQQDNLTFIHIDLPFIQKNNPPDKKQNNLPGIQQDNLFDIQVSLPGMSQEKPQIIVEENMPVLFKDFPNHFDGMDYEAQITPTDSSNNITKDLSDFIILNTAETNKTKRDDIAQFRVSKRGTLQLLLNKYLYHCHHQSCEGYKRRWRCINYRKLHCQAVIDTVGDDIINRSEIHNHPAPNFKLISMFKKDMIHTKLSSAVNSKDKLKLTKKKRK